MIPLPPRPLGGMSRWVKPNQYTSLGEVTCNAAENVEPGFDLPRA